MSKDEIMEKAAENECRVRIMCTDGELFIGDAFSYVGANDEEDGASSICIDPDDDHEFPYCLSANEIETIEILDNDGEENDDGKA